MYNEDTIAEDTSTLLLGKEDWITVLSLIHKQASSARAALGFWNVPKLPGLARDDPRVQVGIIVGRGSFGEYDSRHPQMMQVGPLASAVFASLNESNESAVVVDW